MKKNFFRVIVADDSKAMRLLLKQIIDQNNITPYVEEAEDGTVVMEKLSKFKPDLVILDLKMPKMDGLDTIKEIKKLEPTTAILRSIFQSNSKNFRCQKDCLCNRCRNISREWNTYF